MILKNGAVMTDAFALKKLDIRIAGGRIAELGENLSGDEVLDLQGKLILPGFIDTHVHGSYGMRIDDEGACFDKMLAYLATQGVTGIAITTASFPHKDLCRQMALAKSLAGERYGSKILAIHAEGPFLSLAYKGSMLEKNVALPNIEKFDEMLTASGGLLKIMTIAPELEGALDLIRHAVFCGVVVSMGHTDATYDEAMKAIEAGATRMTHTFNAARKLHHREVGVLGAALTSPSVSCEVICDFVHLHPAAIDLIYRMKGVDRMTIVSDSGTAAGWDKSEFTVGGITRYVRDGVVRLADGTIAGSAKTMLDGVQNLIRYGIPLEDVSKMASLTPARAIGAEACVGSIAVGKQADFAVLEGQSYQLERTFVDGACVFEKR